MSPELNPKCTEEGQEGADGKAVQVGADLGNRESDGVEGPWKVNVTETL